MSSRSFNDLFYTLISRISRFITGPVLLLLIPLLLMPEQQGYWYLFVSIASFSILADLGFSSLVLIFSAHEYAFLQFADRCLLIGDELHIKRLGCLFRFIVRRVLTLCLIVFPVTYLIGLIFFIRDEVLNLYWIPWSLYLLGAMIIFVSNFICSFIEGLDKVASIQKIRLATSIVYMTVVTISLLNGLNIYALSFGTLLSACFILFLTIFKFKSILTQILYKSSCYFYNWKREINPLLKRYMIGNSFGWFVFQIYVPVMHYFHGPVYSGMVGLTLALVLSLVDISSIWISSVIPRINMHISQKAWTKLDLLFSNRMKLSLGTYGLGVIVMVGVLYFCKDYWIVPNIRARFLPFISIGILVISYLFQMVISNMAAYLRAHKQEPLMWQAILAGCWVIPTTILAGMYLSPKWIFVGFLSSYFFIFPINIVIFLKCKKKWHEIQV